MYALVLIVGGLKLRVEPQRVVEGAGLEGHQPGDAVHVAVAHAEGAAHVPERGLGPQGTEGDYLRHPVVAVAVDDVMEHLVPPVVLEVQVDVGHLLALQVEEPLEDQPVLQRIDVGYAQAVEGHAGGGAAPHAEQYVVAAHEADDVPHHQEIIGEPGVIDNLQLVTEPLLGVAARVGIAAPEPFLAQLGQVLVGVHVVGSGIARQVGAVEVQLHVAHVGHQPGVVQGPPEVREELGHLLRAFDVIGVVLHPQAFFVLGGGAGLDADVDVLQPRFRLAHVVGVVGDDQGQIQVFAEPHQAAVDVVQSGNVFVPLDFQEVAVAEPVLVPVGRADGVVIVAVGEQTRHLGGRATGQADQAGAELFQQPLVDAGAIVKAVNVGLGNQLHQVAVAGVVAGQQHQVVGAALRRVLVQPALVGDVDLAADDGLDARVAAGRVEVDHPVEGAVIGDRQGVHAQLPGPRHQVGDTADAVEHTVFGMNVKVSKQLPLRSLLALGDAHPRAGKLPRPWVRHRYYRQGYYKRTPPRLRDEREGPTEPFQNSPLVNPALPSLQPYDVTGLPPVTPAKAGAQENPRRRQLSKTSTVPRFWPAPERPYLFSNQHKKIRCSWD